MPAITLSIRPAFTPAEGPNSRVPTRASTTHMLAVSGSMGGSRIILPASNTGASRIALPASSMHDLTHILGERRQASGKGCTATQRGRSCTPTRIATWRAITPS
jgi:hypothetical protein